MSPTQTIQALFVAWQHPKTRRYYPVARLVTGTEQNHDSYEFAYISGAKKAGEDGFKPFPSFPDMDRVYHSEKLFPLFSNRLMSQNRPDYSSYVSQLGLNPENTDPMLILARSGGIRATDSLELFSYPTQSLKVGCYETYFLSHGLRHFPEVSRKRVLSIDQGERLYIVVDFQNPIDNRALMLRTEDRINIGYLPRYLLNDTWNLMSDCPDIEVYAAQANPDPTPLQQRLLCRLVSCWPDSFKPFEELIYKPLSADATQI